MYLLLRQWRGLTSGPFRANEETAATGVCIQFGLFTSHWIAIVEWPQPVSQSAGGEAGQ